jgi:hypothetical protein
MDFSKVSDVDELIKKSDIDFYELEEDQELNYLIEQSQSAEKEYDRLYLQNSSNDDLPKLLEIINYLHTLITRQLKEFHPSKTPKDLADYINYKYSAVL